MDFECKVGKGDRTKFWLDNWNKEGILAEKFSRLFELSTNKNIMVREMLVNWEEAKIGISSHWTRRLRRWEEDELLVLDNVINNTSLCITYDVVIWKVNQAEYSTTSGYKIIQSEEGQE